MTSSVCYFFRLSVSITKAFPIEPPVIKLRSVYHKLDGYPYEVVSKNYEFSSQWSAEEMMEKTKYVIINFGDVQLHYFYICV